MPFGIQNVTPINISTINEIANFTNPAEFFIKVNTIIYQGYFFFSLLWVLWIILFVAGQRREKQPLLNAMYSGAIVSVIAFLLRGVQAIILGDLSSLLTDYQMWIFPLTTILLATFAWATKER